jgi:hypothetical protein
MSNFYIKYDNNQLARKIMVYFKYCVPIGTPQLARFGFVNWLLLISVMLINSYAVAAGLIIEPTSHDFGSVNVDAFSPEKIFILFNEGDSPLPLGFLDEFGNMTTISEFRITEDACSNTELGVIPSDSVICEFAMRFDPKVVGIKQLDFFIPYTDEFGNVTSLTLPLTGTGVLEQVPNIVPTITYYDFGDIIIGNESNRQTIRISNTSEGDLQIGQVRIENTDDFIVLSDLCADQTVGSSQNCSIRTQFKPQSWGNKRATLEIPSNDPDTPTLEIFLNGNATFPPMPDIKTDQPSYDVGEHPVGSSSAYQTVRILNIGDVPLQLGQVSLVGAEFMVKYDLCSNQNLGSAKYCSVITQFLPQSTGVKTATLSIPSNDPDTPTLDISLKGEGILCQPDNDEQNVNACLQTSDFDSEKVLRDISVTAPSQMSGEANSVLPFIVTLSNGGQEPDTFLLNISDTAGWTLSSLPFTLELEEQQTLEILLDVILPATVGATNVITITAISQANPEAISTVEIPITVTENRGTASVDEGIINLPGINTTIDGGDVTISTSQHKIDFSYLDGNKVVMATGTITLAVGEDGIIDLRGNQSVILETIGEVIIFADETNILLDSGVQLSDLVKASQIVVKASKSAFGVFLTVPNHLSQQVGILLPVKFTLENTGLETDTYALNVIDSSSWAMTQLPSLKRIKGLDSVELLTSVTLPSTVDTTNVITVTATSQTDSTIVATAYAQISTADTTIVVVPIISTNTCASTGVIRQLCKNHGTIKDATIEEKISISGGTFAGIIENKGLISRATIETDAVLRGGKLTGYIINKGTLADFNFVGAEVKGGTLSGIITNRSQVGGVFIDVHLAANTRIEGGAVQGEITGDDEGPALLENVTVQAGSRLSKVIIGKNVHLPQDVVLSEGVRFVSQDVIPPDVELIGLLPTLSVNDLVRTDFSADVLEPSDGLLVAINELLLFKDNAWVLKQNAELGYFELSIDNTRFAVLPVSVKKATSSVGTEIQEAQRVRFTTNTGIEILTQPALQAPSVFRLALSEFGLTEFTVQTNGHLQIPSTEEQWFSACPDWLSTEQQPDTKTGLLFSQSSLVNGLMSISLVFTDSEGKIREQFLYPAIAQPEMLYSSAKEVDIKPHGLVNFRLAGKTYRGVVDYVVSTPDTDSTTGMLQVESIPDINGDGIKDIMLIYSTGEQQIMFALPEP